MSLFKRIGFVAQDVSSVKNTRKAIFEVRDRLRNTPQFSDIFYKLIPDPYHPPIKIVANQAGTFWSATWMAATRSYEPFTTMKIENSNLGYVEGCAVFLLIQECYPKVYDFPNNTMSQISAGAVIELNMFNQFVGEAFVPVAPPPAPVSAPATAPVQTAPVAITTEMNVASGKFCTQCGTKNGPNARFCCACGKPL